MVSSSFNVICDLISGWEATQLDGEGYIGPEATSSCGALPHVSNTHAVSLDHRRRRCHGCPPIHLCVPSISQLTDSEQVRRTVRSLGSVVHSPKRAKTANRQRPADIADDPPRTQVHATPRNAPRASVHSATSLIKRLCAFPYGLCGDTYLTNGKG